MIQLTITQALALYTFLVGSLAVSIWAYTEFSVRRPQRALGKQFLWRCTICGFTYLDDRAEEMSECPQCGTLLSATDKGAREVITADGNTVPNETEEKSEVRKGSKRKRPHARRRGPRRRR